MATFTHANTKTWSRIQFTMIQIRLLLRTTTSISEEKLSAIRVGIERRWIRDVNIFAIDKNNFCKAQLVIRIDWDSYDVRRFVEKSFVFLGDKESTDLQNNLRAAIEIDDVISAFNKFVSENALSTMWNVVFQPNAPDIDDDQVKSLGISHLQPIKWQIRKNDREQSDLPKTIVGSYVVI